MNDRIKELIEQCTELLWKDTPYQREKFDKEKFAELIVRECLNVINQPNGVGDDDVIRISDDVKRHFGMDNNIAAAERIHSDKGYSLGTPEAQEAFDSKRGYIYDKSN